MICCLFLLKIWHSFLYTILLLNIHKRQLFAQCQSSHKSTFLQFKRIAKFKFIHLSPQTKFEPFCFIVNKNLFLPSTYVILKNQKEYQEFFILSTFKQICGTNYELSHNQIHLSNSFKIIADKNLSILRPTESVSQFLIHLFGKRDSKIY